MEQLKTSLFAYYIGNPVKRAGKAIRRGIDKIYDKATGRWYCAGCGEYHHGRVIGFYMCRECDGVCGKHISAADVQKCEVITVGGYWGRDISERVKRELREKDK
jgi:ribosomal protein L37AE/L43A